MRSDGSVGEPQGDAEGRAFAHDNLTSQTANETTTFSFHLNERLIPKPKKGGWKSNRDGIERLKKANRIIRIGNTPRYIRYFDDAPYYPMGSGWTDTGISGFGAEKVYVVQTHPLVVQRCLLMTTDPGDLVLDPTCGSGTTAYVAEQWGRRWITIDTSRVALTLAKHRLMTAKFDYFRLRELTAEDVARNPEGTWIEELGDDGQPTGHRLTFDCRTVPHITLRSIARNTSLDPIFAKHEPILNEALRALNVEAAKAEPDLKQTLADKLLSKHREEGATAVTDADVRRWLLPDTPHNLINPVSARRPLKALTARQAASYRERIPQGEWRDWQAPFDIDPDWPKSLQEALSTYRSAWREKMEEVNNCIAGNAELEELVDKPEIVKDTVRVAGPFSVEGVIALEEAPDSPIGGAPDELGTFPEEDPGDLALVNAEAHLHKVPGKAGGRLLVQERAHGQPSEVATGRGRTGRPAAG